jgi:predicted methyltransferase
VRREIEAAGFRFVADASFLRNPADPRDREEPVPPMPKDEFVLKFVRP